MTIADKLVYLNDTKAAIRSAIQSMGVAVPEETTFRGYAAKVAEIEGGGGVEYPVRVSSVWSAYVTATSVTAPAFGSGVIQDGDLLVLTLMTRREPTSVPAGFVEVERSPKIGALEQFLIVYKKTSDGEEEGFEILLSGTADRTCVNVSAFRGSVTPNVVMPSGSLEDTSAQVNYQINLGAVSNPSLNDYGLVVMSATTSLANTTATSGEINVPFYGWHAIHNTFGTSSSHQNRMMINAKYMVPGESSEAFAPFVAMSNVDGLALVKYLVAVQP